MKNSDVKFLNRLFLAFILVSFSFTLFLTRASGQCQNGTAARPFASSLSDNPVFEFKTERETVGDTLTIVKTDWRISFVQAAAIQKGQTEKWLVYSIEAGRDGVVIVNMEGGDRLILRGGAEQFLVELHSTIDPRIRIFY